MPESMALVTAEGGACNRTRPGGSYLFFNGFSISVKAIRLCLRTIHDLHYKEVAGLIAIDLCRRIIPSFKLIISLK